MAENVMDEQGDVMIKSLLSGRLWKRPSQRADRCTYMAFVDLEKAYKKCE